MRITLLIDEGSMSICALVDFGLKLSITPGQLLVLGKLVGGQLLETNSGDPEELVAQLDHVAHADGANALHRLKVVLAVVEHGI